MSRLKSLVVSYICILVCFGVMDGIWLGVVADGWYTELMQSFIRETPIAWPWLAFYLIYGVATLILCVVANKHKPWFYATTDGAILGLASYGAYNLTNYSLVENFALSLAFGDWLWGILLTASCATAGWHGWQLVSDEELN